MHSATVCLGVVDLSLENEMTRSLFWIGVAALTLAVGLALPRLVIPDGIQQFDDDPSKRAVAQRAYNAAWALSDNPITHIVLPAAQVRSIKAVPGSCPKGWPGYGEQDADYIALVRFYTIFAIPGPAVSVSCGGRRWHWA